MAQRSKGFLLPYDLRECIASRTDDVYVGFLRMIKNLLSREARPKASDLFKGQLL